MKKILLFTALFPLSFFGQILNGGMENHTYTSVDTLPSEWSVDSDWSTIVGQSTDAHSGNYSFAINTWYHYSPGRMVNGDAAGLSLLDDWIYAGTPINYTPQQMQGWYKYTDTVANDSAIVKVALKKWNTALNKIDTFALGEKKLPFAGSWTPFYVDIQPMLTCTCAPDSIVIFFMTYDYYSGIQSICQNSICRFLYIDDLTLTGVSSLNEKTSISQIKCWSSEKNIYFKNHSETEMEAEFYSSEGRLIFKKRIDENASTWNVSEYDAGVYFVRLPLDGKTFKVVIQ